MIKMELWIYSLQKPIDSQELQTKLQWVNFEIIVSDKE